MGSGFGIFKFFGFGQTRPITTMNSMIETNLTTLIVHCFTDVDCAVTILVI